MEVGRVTIARGYTAAWIIVPRRRFFSWYVYVTTHVGETTYAVGSWTFWTRRGARARVGAHVADLVALAESTAAKAGPETDADPMNRR